MRKPKPSTSLYNVPVDNDCRLIREKLSAYSKGELSPEERDAVTGHLGSCSACGQKLGSLRVLAENPPVAKNQPAIPKPAFAVVAVVLVAAAAAAVLAARARTGGRPEASAPKTSVTAPAPVAAIPAVPVAMASAPATVTAAKPPPGPFSPKAGDPPPPTFPPAPVSVPASPNQAPKIPAAGRRLRARLYVKDPMAANNLFLHLMAEIPARLVEPPVPIHYDLLLQPEVAEIFLQRMKEIGTAELQQESEGSPEAPTRLIVDILPRD